MKKDIKKLYIVVPCYNESEILDLMIEKFLFVYKNLVSAGKISKKSQILLVDDGSTDNTWKIIKKNTKNQSILCGISLSKNFGHQKALIAGMSEVVKSADMIVTIDCDGQDDINKIEDMIDEFYKGFDVVYGVRNSRSFDSFFKRFFAEMYYKLLCIFGVETIYNHADFRLLSKRAVEAILLYKESNIYLRGMIPLIGFRHTVVTYDRKKREAGKTHYTINKMTTLAIDGITSFSVIPLKLIIGMGIFVAVLSFVGVVWSIIRAMTGKTVIGWASTACIICFVSGIQLLCIGVLGIYIGKIYIETKNRPKFFINERC